MCTAQCESPNATTDRFRAYPSDAMSVANDQYHAVTLESTSSVPAQFEADRLFALTGAKMVHLIRYCTHGTAQSHWFKSAFSADLPPVLNGKVSAGWHWNSDE